MASPPQARSNPATVAEQQARAFQLKMSGWSHDRIAAELGVSHGTVANRLEAAITERVGPAAQEYVDHREAELVELFGQAFRIAVTAAKTADRINALEQCRRLNESRRRLRGADAPESIAITHEANLTLTADLTTAAILAVLTGLRLTGPRRDYALALAQHAIDHDGDPDAPGAPPVPDDLPPEPYVDPARRYVIVDGVTYVRPERDQPKALPPGPSAGRSPQSGPVPPAGSPEDAVDAVMAALDAFETEHGGLDDAEDDT